MVFSSLTVTAWVLAIFAVVLAWPAPLLLSRARFARRSPATAMILWQALGLAGGLSMIGAFLTWGLAPLADNLYIALFRLAKIVLNLEPLPDELDFWHMFALSVAALLGAHLLFTLVLTYVRIARQRARHRDRLMLLVDPGSSPEGTVVINHAVPVAYCIPGGSRSVTVLSEGLLNLLSEAEMAGVLSHEKTHLIQRHHLLLWAFAAWRAALPWLPTTRLAQESVSELIEMLADDAALKEVPRLTLVRAIALVAGSGAEGAAPARTDQLDAGEVSAARITRLMHPQPPLSSGKRTIVQVAAALLLILPTVLLLVPSAI